MTLLPASLLALLPLQVLGNMKGVIAAGISIAMFKNPVTAKGMLGYFITVCGVVAYSEASRVAELALGALGFELGHPGCVACSRLWRGMQLYLGLCHKHEADIVLVCVCVCARFCCRPSAAASCASCRTLGRLCRIPTSVLL